MIGQFDRMNPSDRRKPVGPRPSTSTVPSTERRIAGIASRQHGVVTRAQLLGAGLTRHQVSRRIETDRLRRLHRGVYLLGPLRTEHTAEMAAVLAAGPGAVVSHRSAAVLWKILRRREGDSVVDLTVHGGRNRSRRPGIHTRRRGGAPDRGEVSELHRIPVTTPARTIIDLAAEAARRDQGAKVTLRELEQAIAHAEREDLTGPAELVRLMEQRPRRPGTGPLRGLLGGGARPAFTRSEAEERLLELVRKAQLPAPELNARVGCYEVDCLWRSERVVVEVDGRRFHSSRRHFENDRRRDARLSAEGFRVVRVTWSQLTQESEAVLVRIGQVLARARG